MAQLELVTLNPPTGEGYDDLEPIRVPASSVKAWGRRGWTVAEEAENTEQGTNAQGSVDGPQANTPAPASRTAKTNAPSSASPETTAP